MYKCINGWTKTKMLKTLKARRYNTGAWDDVKQACVYLTSNGNKCAIGMFIPSGHPGQKYVGGIHGLAVDHPDLMAEMPLNIEAMDRFQGVHDCATTANQNAKQAMIDWVKKNVTG